MVIVHGGETIIPVGRQGERADVQVTINVNRTVVSAKLQAEVVKVVRDVLTKRGG